MPVVDIIMREKVNYWEVKKGSKIIILNLESQE